MVLERIGLAAEKHLIVSFDAFVSGARNVKRSIAIGLLLLLSTRAHAHDTWLLPGRRAIEAPGSVTFDMTSGMAFPALDYAIARDRVERAEARLNGRRWSLGAGTGAAHALRFTARLPETGVAAVTVDLAPKSLDLAPEQVREYLEEIGATETAGRAYAAMPEPRHWRELYVKHAKTFVRVGAPPTDRSWAQPMGARLEFVPDVDPTALRAGDTLPVRLLRNGKAAAGLTVSLVREGEGEGKGILSTTDADGRVRLVLDRAGLWLIRCTDLRPSSKPKLDWESDFATLTIEVTGK